MAEAANELNRPGEALQYLEMVRARARASATQPDALPQITESGKDNLREIIWKERRVELACEGQRFWDLVRQGRAGQVMRAYAAKYNSYKGQYFVDGVSEVVPIPRDQVDISNGTWNRIPGTRPFRYLVGHCPQPESIVHSLHPDTRPVDCFPG
jgi:hypothetical protein